MRTLLGTWPVTQVCPLTGNRTGDPLIHSKHSIHCATPARALHFLFQIALYQCHFPLFIKFIQVTLVNKIIEVSGVQFYNTSSEHCIMCLPPQVKSPCIPMYPPIPSSTLLHPSPSQQSPHCCPYPWAFFLFAQSLHLTTQPPAPNSLLSIYESVAILLISSFSLLDSTMSEIIWYFYFT